MDAQDEIRAMKNLSITHQGAGTAMTDAEWVDRVAAILTEPQWCPIREHYCRCDQRCDDYAVNRLAEYGEPCIPVSIRKPSCSCCARRCEPSQLTHGRCGRCSRDEGYEGGSAGTMFAAMGRPR